MARLYRKKRTLSSRGLHLTNAGARQEEKIWIGSLKITAIAPK